MYNLYGNDYIELFRSFYPEVKVVSGRKELVVRCKFCGDSNNPRNAHMYISIPQDEKSVSLYECKKCKAAGMVNTQFLQLYGCTDPQVFIDLNEHLNEYTHSSKFSIYKKRKYYHINNNYIKDIPLASEKLRYLNSRLGVNLSLRDWLQLKIVFNLNDIIYSNHFEKTRSDNIIQALNDNFIGFISQDNTYISLRKINDIELFDNINKRYIYYKLMDVYEYKTYYVIPSQIDMQNPEVVNIHITEGPFDILGVYFHLNDANNKQNIYISSSGKSYKQALEYIFSITGVMNYNINIYPDNDISDRELYHLILKHIMNLPCNINVIRNVYPNQKDFGVTRKLINPLVNQVKRI